MTANKKKLREKIIAELDKSDAEGLDYFLRSIKQVTNAWENNYQLFSKSVFVDRTRDLSKKPMQPLFKDAIYEALSIMPSPEEIKLVKRQARMYRQTYIAEEVATWPQQYMLVYRTGIYDYYKEGTKCKICGYNSLNQIIMLQVGLQAGPFCKKCLRRIPKSWYCQK